MTKLRTRLAVFDLDGTLVDSLQDLAESINELLAHHGVAPHPIQSIGAMVGDGAATLVARAFAAASVPRPADALARFLSIYNGRLVRFTKPYPGIPETLDALAARMQLAVLTNKPLGPSCEILQTLDLQRFFAPAAVVGGDGPLPRKPDPAGLCHLIGRADVAPGDTVLVGDSAIDLQTARAAKTRACHARYGFGSSGVPAGLLEGASIADSPGALVTLL